MSIFSAAELAYLAEGKLGRLATIDPAGMPHVVPLGWTYNPALDTIDVGGRDFARSRKLRNVQGEALPEASGADGNPIGPNRPDHPNRGHQLGPGRFGLGVSLTWLLTMARYRSSEPASC